jgi:hypothetical protein
MAGEDLVGQIKRSVDRGVRQLKRTAENVEAEARIFALHRKIGLRAYQLWRANQLSHPDLEEDFHQLAKLETAVDAAEPAAPESPLGATRVAPAPSTCPHCARPLYAGARFCTYCGQSLA